MPRWHAAGGFCWFAEQLPLHLKAIDVEHQAALAGQSRAGLQGSRLLRSLWCLALEATADLRREAGLPAFDASAAPPQDLFRGNSVRAAGTGLLPVYFGARLTNLRAPGFDSQHL
jgi:hypothetical protein